MLIKSTKSGDKKEGQRLDLKQGGRIVRDIWRSNPLRTVNNNMSCEGIRIKRWISWFFLCVAKHVKIGAKLLTESSQHVKIAPSICGFFKEGLPKISGSLNDNGQLRSLTKSYGLQLNRL